jgi:REP element-mobilizing transposase RayT
VTLKFEPVARSLRTLTGLDALRRVIQEVHARDPNFRVIAFSLQPNHLHLIVEGDSARALGSGLRSLCIRVTKRLNQALGRRGRLFQDRYHRRVLSTPLEVRNAYAYVLCNRRRHLAQRGRSLAGEGVDTYSSGGWFDGWRGPAWRERRPPIVAAPRTWLARVGWRRHGLLSALEVPGVPRRGRGSRVGPAAPAHG